MFFCLILIDLENSWLIYNSDAIIFNHKKWNVSYKIKEIGQSLYDLISRPQTIFEKCGLRIF